MAKGKGLLITGVLCLIGYGILKASTTPPIAVYVQGPVTVKITAVHSFGFSYEVWVGGKMIFSDTVYQGDDEYTVRSTVNPNYDIDFSYVNDQPVLNVYDQAGNQVNTNSFNMYWNGSQLI